MLKIAFVWLVNFFCHFNCVTLIPHVNSSSPVLSGLVSPLGGSLIDAMMVIAVLFVRPVPICSRSAEGGI
jgi:hypothetical protein